MPEDEFKSFEILYKEVVIDGVIYPLPEFALHRPACRHFLAGSLFEPVTHRFFVKYLHAFPGDAIHAGAFFGDMLPTLSKHCNGKVYSFEPVLENYVVAHHCIAVNQLENVYLFNSALSKQLGLAYIRTRSQEGQHFGGASLITRRASLSQGQLCVTTTIDSLGLSNLALIHLDVENHEHLALLGATETLARLRPALLLENPGARLNEFLSSIEYAEALSIPSLKLYLPREAPELPEDLRSEF